MRGLEFTIPGFRTIGAARLPHRKRPMLYRVDGATLTTMATFRDTYEAELFLTWLSLATGSGGTLNLDHKTEVAHDKGRGKAKKRS
jgi:hypothetical protein